MKLRSPSRKSGTKKRADGRLLEPGLDSFVSKPKGDIRTLGVFALKGDAGPAMDIVRAFAAAHPEVRVCLNSTLRQYMEPRHGRGVAGKGMRVHTDAYLGAQVDALLSLGGDGTFLTAARLAHGHGIPVLGVNLGRTGFLADVSLGNLGAILEDLLRRDYTLRSRMLLQVDHLRGRKLLFRDIALNEGAFAGLMGGQMTELEVKANGRFLTGYRVDGLLVSTPTGSTAYSLSAGGPIVHPSANSLLLTPMNPASLSVRPVVLPDSMVIEVRNMSDASTGGKSVNIFADGRERGVLKPGDVVRIRKHPVRLSIIRPHGSSYFDALRNKLGWTGDRDLRSGIRT